MNSVNQVMTKLKKKGNPLRIKAFAPHGGPKDMFGVSVADMKILAKQIKGQQQLAMDLYETGNADAMYLAGMIADGAQMTKRQLESWARSASWQMLSEYTVPWVASESKHARDLAIKWMAAKKESVASSGWSTYSGIVATKADDELDLKEIKTLLKDVENEIRSAANRVRYTMNGFVISVGTYVKPLTRQAKNTAKKLGKVDVDMHGTTCKVPLALDAIEKVEKAGRIGKKRKSIKC